MTAMTKDPSPKGSSFNRFKSDERGAIFVEFALTLPLFLLFFMFATEAGRLLYSYQSAAAGVRDAGRYMARVAPVERCLTDGAGEITGYRDTLKDIVAEDITEAPVLLSSVQVNSVVPVLECIVGDYRISPAPVVTVTANVTVQFPFGGVFGLFGEELTSVTTDISDEARVFGQ